MSEGKKDFTAASKILSGTKNFACKCFQNLNEWKTYQRNEIKFSLNQ